MGTFTIPQPERYTLVQLDSESPTGNAWHECDGSSLTENGHTYTVPHAAGSILAATGQIPEYEGTGSPIQTIPRGRSGSAHGAHFHEPNGGSSYFEVIDSVGMANYVPGDHSMPQITSANSAMPITFGRKMFMRL